MSKFYLENKSKGLVDLRIKEISLRVIIQPESISSRFDVKYLKNKRFNDLIDSFGLVKKFCDEESVVKVEDKPSEEETVVEVAEPVKEVIEKPVSEDKVVKKTRKKKK